MQWLTLPSRVCRFGVFAGHVETLTSAQLCDKEAGQRRKMLSRTQSRNFEWVWLLLHLAAARDLAKSRQSIAMQLPHAHKFCVLTSDTCDTSLYFCGLPVQRKAVVQ